MSNDDHRSSPSSTAVTAAGLDHVRLSYLYLDCGDIDAYGSLLHENVQVTRPDMPCGHGRAEVLDLHANLAGPAVRHHIYKMVADGDCIAVMGRLTQLATDQDYPDVDFADFFTLSDEGMLLACRRFYFTPPSMIACCQPAGPSRRSR